VARYIVIAKFRSYRDFAVGEVLDTATDPRVAQLVTDGAPIVPETQEAIEAAARANYFNMQAITPGVIVVGSQEGPIVIQSNSSNTTHGYILVGESDTPVTGGLSRRGDALLNVGPVKVGQTYLAVFTGTERGPGVGTPYNLWITETCTIATNGALIVNGKQNNAAEPVKDALGRARSAMVGISSDVDAGASNLGSCLCSISNSAVGSGLDHFQALVETDNEPRFRITHNADLRWSDGANADDLRIRRSAAATLTFDVNAALDIALQLSEPGAGEVAMLVRRNLAGVFTLQRVSMNGVDTAGAGFRALRVPN
jgi:hypothetical protein